jgi:hypothetical protein
MKKLKNSNYPLINVKLIVRLEKEGRIQKKNLQGIGFKLSICPKNSFDDAIVLKQYAA